MGCLIPCPEGIIPPPDWVKKPKVWGANRSDRRAQKQCFILYIKHCPEVPQRVVRGLWCVPMWHDQNDNIFCFEIHTSLLQHCYIGPVRDDLDSINNTWARKTFITRAVNDRVSEYRNLQHNITPGQHSLTRLPAHLLPDHAGDRPPL